MFNDDKTESHNVMATRDDDDDDDDSDSEEDHNNSDEINNMSFL